MYAIIEVGGMQWKVRKSEKIQVPRINAEPGKSITVDKVLLVVDKENVSIGKPFISNATVQAKILSHGKSKKVMVFKKKRRKDYKVTRGHRQDFTEIQIDQISIGKSAKPQTADTGSKPKETAAKKTAAKPAPKKADSKSKPAADKKTADKTTAKAKQSTAAGKKSSGRSPAKG